MSADEPTYWPTDINKTPDLLDFYIVKGLSNLYTVMESCLDGSSDHTPVIATISIVILRRKRPLTLYNERTDWDAFADYLENRIDLKINLKTKEDLDDATFYITNLIQEAWRSSLDLEEKDQAPYITVEIREKICEKRRLRKKWHQNRNMFDKKAYNRSAKELTLMIDLHVNNNKDNKLKRLSSTKKDNYSLWKVTKNFKRPIQHIPPLKTKANTWAQTDGEKVQLFAEHLREVFTANQSDMIGFKEEIDRLLNSDQQLSPTLKRVTPRETAGYIRYLKNKKAPG